MTGTTLASKIARASIEVGAFQADKQNKDQNYAYISADAILSRAGDALAKQGIAVLPQITAVEIGVVERQGKSARIDAKVSLSIVVTDGEKEYTFAWFGFGTDYAAQDKAVYKAITSGHKYFLMKLLNIGVGNEDGEHENAPRENGNGRASEPSGDPLPAYVWAHWQSLVDRARAVNIEPPAIDRSKATYAELEDAGVELRRSVEAAEAQARAADGSPA